MATIVLRRTAATLLPWLSTLSARFAEAQRRHRAYRKALTELEMLSDHDLADIGISRANISRIAREAAWANNE